MRSLPIIILLFMSVIYSLSIYIDHRINSLMVIMTKNILSRLEDHNSYLISLIKENQSPIFEDHERNNIFLFCSVYKSELCDKYIREK